LLRQHAFQAERQTRREERIGRECQRREESVRARQINSCHSHHVIYALCSLYSFYIHYTRL
jgi:hypothetical protein